LLLLGGVDRVQPPCIIESGYLPHGGTSTGRQCSPAAY
jgi:hypothetical protein